MSTMVKEVYVALKSIGVEDDKAIAVAEAMAEPEKTIEKNEKQTIDKLNDLSTQIIEMKANIALIKWMVGFMLTFTLIVIGMLWRLTIS